MDEYHHHHQQQQQHYSDFEEEGEEGMDEYIQQQKQKQKQVNEYHDLQVHHQDIPEIIIFNILIRIPPELLFTNFRSVCRSWLDIISTPLFVQQLPNYSKSSLLLQFIPPGRYPKSKILPTKIRMLDQGGGGGGDQREFEILNKQKNNHLPSMGRIRANCNGLLLTHDPSSSSSSSRYYPEVKIIVFNPVTRSIHTLPKCISGCRHKTCSFSLAFDSSTDTYKVVHMYADQFGFEIYNLGTAATTTTTGSGSGSGSDDDQHSKHSKRGKKKKRNRRKKKILLQRNDDNDNEDDNNDDDNDNDNDDDDDQNQNQNQNQNHDHDDGKYSWRKVPGPFESIYDRPFNVDKFCWSDATMVNSKFLHWKVDSKDYIISMDVSDERSRKTPLPHNHEAYYNLNRLDYTLVEMGGYLAIMFGVQPHDTDDDDDEHNSIIDQLDFWILKDFEEGIWMKKLSISMECINFVKCQPQLDMLRPRGCLEDGEVIVFERISSGSSSASSGLYVYNVENSSMKKLAMKMKLGEYKVVVYKSCFTSWTKESKS